MINITSLKATQSAYVRAGTQIGTVSKIAPKTLPNHLHFALYEWDGTKLRSRATTLLQMAQRPNMAIVGSIKINNQIVNQSPWTVPRNLAFTMNLTVRNNGTVTAYGNYYLILTRDQNGAQYIGKVDDLAFCSTVGPGQQLRVDFDKQSLTSPAGNYFLQVYHDDCSTGGAALKRVSGVNPIAIRLQ